MDPSVCTQTPAEFLAEIAHQVDVRAGEAEDRLPVVADRKDSRIRVLCLQGTQQPRSCRRHILELVDQKMTIGTAVAAALDMTSRTIDHVVEVDLIAQTLLIGRQQRLEDRQEGAIAGTVLSFRAPGAAKVDRQAGALEVAQERCERLREPIDLAYLRQLVEQLVFRDRLRFDMRREFFLE